MRRRSLAKGTGPWQPSVLVYLVLDQSGVLFQDAPLIRGDGQAVNVPMGDT